MNEPLQVELLDRYREDAHLRLQQHHIPNLWAYAVEWYRQKREFYTYNGFLLYEFWFHTVNDIPKGETPVFKELEEMARWANKAYINWRRHDDRPGGNLCFRFIKTPDNHWLVSEAWGPWVEVDRTKKDQNGKTGYDFQPYQGMPHNRYYWNHNCKQVEIPAEIKSLDENFKKAWRDARQQYRKILQETGESRKRHENILDEAYVQRTDIRMKVAAQASKAKDLLDVFVKSINDESMTVAQIGELYYALTELGALNKDMKKIYGAKMPKK